MPELPDVEGFRHYLNRHALHRNIRSVQVPDPRVLKGTTPQALGRKLKGRALSGTRRHGKFLLGEASPVWLVLHFGMTGEPAIEEDLEPSGPKRPVFRLDFHKGDALFYVSQRMLGQVTWIPDPESLVRDEHLGPDALDPHLSAEDFLTRLSNSRGRLKTALMNQSLIAGIGNIWADEILFQCRLPPLITVPELSRDRLRSIYKVLRRVLRTGSRACVKARPLPRSYLGRDRRTGAPCPECGTGLGSVKTGSRTSYYCPRCQA